MQAKITTSMRSSPMLNHLLQKPAGCDLYRVFLCGVVKEAPAQAKKLLKITLVETSLKCDVTQSRPE